MGKLKALLDLLPPDPRLRAVVVAVLALALVGAVYAVDPGQLAELLREFVSEE